MLLLERETQLAQLTDGYDLALHGQGQLVLLHGEAGAGKTSLVQQFLQAIPAGTTRLVAGCEPLFTARPFGPLVDLARSLPPSIASALRDDRPNPALFPDFLAFLRESPGAKIVVIDDLHWADAGTLDLVRYVGRRLGSLPVLFVAAYRDDDLGAIHPLRILLGDLPAATTARVAVPCLSQAAVSTLACAARRAGADVFEITGGNPFFVTEILAGGEGVVPPSVFDSIAGRLACLSAEARALAELVAVSPGWIERALVVAMDANADVLIDECAARGLLRLDHERLSFRHELARQAAEQSLGPGRAAALHRRLFAAIGQRSTVADSLSRLVHHARLAGLGDDVLSLAPRAARAASIASAHREAARHYTLALQYAAGLDPASRAGLLELAADEYRLVSDVEATITATHAALELRRALCDHLHEGMNLRRLAGALQELGRRADAEEAIAAAIEALERVEPSADLVRAYAEQSRLRVWSNYGDAVAIGERALALAERMPDARALVEALHACMMARMYLGDDREARTQLQRALDIAVSEKLEDAAAQLFVALQLAGVIHRDHAFAIEVADRGLAYCEARDLDAFVFRLLDNRALSLIELGRWDEADADLGRCLAAPHLADRLRNSILFLKARQDARRGVAGSEAYWAGLQEKMDAVALGYRLPAIAAACAEAAWLRGDPVAAQQAIRAGIENAAGARDARLLGPLLVWARRCGIPVRNRGLVVTPAHACELAGDIAGAAAHWQAHGCPYERALALLQGDKEQVEASLGQFDGLGARPAADIARRRLRRFGARGIRRGPQAHTLADPHGLTTRERQVYELLVQGLSNAGIADRLHRSERTIEHHVASVLGKFGATSRNTLVAGAAHRLAGKKN